MEHGEKLKHIKTIKQLASIIENVPPPHKTTDEGPQRVDTPTTSVNLTEHQAVKKMKLIHQRRTRSNTPMPASIEEEEDEGVQRVRPQREATPISSENLTEPQTIRKIKKIHQKKPRNDSPMPTIIEEEEEEGVQRVNDKRNKQRRKKKKKAVELPQPNPSTDATLEATKPMNPKAHQTPITSQDSEDEEGSEGEPQPSPPQRRSTHLQCQRPSSTAFIARDVVVQVLATGYYEAPEWSVPEKSEEEKLTISSALDVDEAANGVVHPVTGETITKHKQLMEDPLLQKMWQEAMCRELGRSSQGCADVEGTNTVHFLTHEEIRNVPADRMVTHARTVVDHRPHKPEEPNRVRLTAGGNLIDCPGELTTRTADLITAKMHWNSVISTEGARCMTADAKKLP